jgi:CheY-like chemotaxis protein
MKTINPLRRVLVVDDDSCFRRLLRLLLANVGCDVAVASDGREALRLQARFRAEVVILDLVMPGMDGFETIRHLRRLEPAPQILAISGGCNNDRSGLLARALAHGADLILPKPCESWEIALAVQTLFSGHTDVAAAVSTNHADPSAKAQPSRKSLHP